MSKKFLSPIKLAQGSSNPASGSAGEIFFNTTDTKMYIHNGTSWVISGGGVTVSDTKPPSPTNGDLWYYSAEGTAFVYYNDGNTSQWVQASSVIASADPNPMPAGSIMAWGGATAPNNWLICDGAAISRSTYASLFAAIGTTYGTGDGSTTFNLPNLKGKVVVGLDSSQTEFDALGETGGAKTVTLTTAQIPSHTHTQNSHTHSGTTSTNGNHGHNILSEYGASGEGYFNPYNNRQIQPAQGGAGTRVERGGDGMIVANGNHNHTFVSDAQTAVNQNTGGGEAHPNLQPYITLNYIIKISAGVTPGDSQLTTRVSTLEVQNNTTPLSPNYFINGALDHWQRSTSATQAGNSNGFPSADRIRVISAGASSPAITLARSTDVPVGIGAQYSAAMSWSSNISGGDIIMHQGIENGKFLFAGKTITFSFYAKAATAIQSKFDFDQDYNETFFNLTTSWARYSYTVTLPSNYGTSRPEAAAQNDNVEMRFIRFTSVSSASNTIYFTGLQVEEGPNATPFRRNGESIQAELAACQRYYFRATAQASDEKVGTFVAYSSSATVGTINLPVTMRVPPSFIEYGGTPYLYNPAGSSAIGGLYLDSASSKNYANVYTSGGSGNASGRFSFLSLPSGAYIGLGAEI